MSELSFHLIGTSSFHVKVENERFTAGGSRCHQNLKFENCMSSFGTLRQESKCVPHMQLDYFSAFKESYHLQDASLSVYSEYHVA